MIAAKRIEQMKVGALELKSWLQDVLRQGLAITDGKSDPNWESFAAKMVDRKLGSIARRIRQMNQWQTEEHWHETLLEEIAALFLFAEAFSKLEHFPQAVQDELVAIGGYNWKKDAILEKKGIADHWLVIALTSGSEDNLTFRRTWLIGENSRRIALILEFVWGRATFEQAWKVGQAFESELVFYPAAYPLRALLKAPKLYTRPLLLPPAYTDFDELLDAYAMAIGQNPWLRDFPGLLNNVLVIFEQKTFHLIDQQKRMIPVDGEYQKLWRLLALGAGKTVQLFGTWDGRAFAPLSVVLPDRIVDLQ